MLVAGGNVVGCLVAGDFAVGCLVAGDIVVGRLVEGVLESVGGVGNPKSSALTNSFTFSSIVGTPVS